MMCRCPQCGSNDTRREKAGTLECHACGYFAPFPNREWEGELTMPGDDEIEDDMSHEDYTGMDIGDQG